MKEEITKIKENSIKEINECKDTKTLSEIKIKYIGKKGELTAVLRKMGTLPPEERPVIGSLVNEIRDELENLIQNKEKQFQKEELLRRLETENIDVTEPSKKQI